MRAFAIAILTLLALAGTASAHATYFTADNKVKIVLGQLGEPVYTYQRSGLDLHLRDNLTNMELSGAAATLNATWIGPGGQELACPLKPQHGAVGKYTCVNAWTLTQPGLYKLRLVGTINGSAVDGVFANKHAIEEQADIMFPDKGLPTLKELEHHAHAAEAKAKAAEDKAKAAEAKVAALETELAALKSRVDKLPAGTGTTAATSIPGFEALLGIAALGTVALGLRLRRS